MEIINTILLFSALQIFGPDDQLLLDKANQSHKRLSLFSKLSCKSGISDQK